MSWSGHRIRRHIIVGMPQDIRCIKKPDREEDGKGYPTYWIFDVKIGIRSNFIHRRIYTQWIIESVLM